jgi:uncharacterized protein YjbI with pentapeptide repeats
MTSTIDTAALRALCRPTRVQLDHIGFRTLQSRVSGYWPSRGWVQAGGEPGGACPTCNGDGACIARTMYGAASGGHSLAHGVLIVGWRDADVLGADEHKLRVRRAYVLGAVTFHDALSAFGANLHGANLYMANLRGANLYRANLHRANLHGADLHGADLCGAALCGAALRGADLHRANLHRANLRGADLRGANLHRANLHGADLYGADLRRADLCGANLYRANLHGADLHGADLCGADLTVAIGYTA